MRILFHKLKLLLFRKAPENKILFLILEKALRLFKNLPRKFHLRK